MAETIADEMGPDAMLSQKAEILAANTNRFDPDTARLFYAILMAERGRILAGVPSATQWQEQTTGWSDQARKYHTWFSTNTPETIRSLIEQLPVIEQEDDGWQPMFSSAVDYAAVDQRFKEDLTLAEMGEPMKGRVLELGPASPQLRLAGIPGGRIFMRKETAIEKPKKSEHPYPRFLLRKLPSALRDPILVHESWTQPGTMVALLDVKHEGKHFVAALHFKPRRDGTEITEIASFYPRDASQIREAFERTAATKLGQSLITTKKRPEAGWPSVRGSIPLNCGSSDSGRQKG